MLRNLLWLAAGAGVAAALAALVLFALWAPYVVRGAK